MAVCKALEAIRPNLLALVMHLSEDDFVMMETCFQRTILEYERLLPSSGTPTALWRRTGEIALTGKEFLFLTQWNTQALAHKRIYEIMDVESVVRYWQTFARLAFDERRSGQVQIRLLTPSGEFIECSCFLTIRCDIFETPFLIIGQFLPILTKSCVR
jgi:hypothetical protein